MTAVTLRIYVMCPKADCRLTSAYGHAQPSGLSAPLNVDVCRPSNGRLGLIGEDDPLAASHKE